jgi:hypothetical protein
LAGITLVLGVPMSRPDTGARQFARLERAGLRVARVANLTDVDTAQDAARVAAIRPDSLFSTRFRALHGAALVASAEEVPLVREHLATGGG